MTHRIWHWAVSETEGTFALVGVYALVFTPSDVSVIIVAVAALITALGTAIAAVMAARRVADSVQEVHAETKVISGHVNSAAAAQIAKIDGLLAEIALLRQEKSDTKETAALLAQAKVQAPVIVPAAKEPL